MVDERRPANSDACENWPGHWPHPARLLAKPELIETVALLPDKVMAILRHELGLIESSSNPASWKPSTPQ